MMSTEIHKTASDLRSFKGRYVRALEKNKAEQAKADEYKQLLAELEVERI